MAIKENPYKDKIKFVVEGKSDVTEKEISDYIMLNLIRYMQRAGEFENLVVTKFNGMNV